MGADGALGEEPPPQATASAQVMDTPSIPSQPGARPANPRVAPAAPGFCLSMVIPPRATGTSSTRCSSTAPAVLFRGDWRQHTPSPGERVKIAANPRGAGNGRRGAIVLTVSGTPNEALDRRTRFELEALPYWRPLYGAAYRMTRSVEDAQDLVQDTFVRAYVAFDRFQPGTNLRAWLFTILHRTRTDRLRRRARRPVETELGDDVGVAAAQERLASGYEDLERALLDLPEAYRNAVVLRDIEELSYREIAEVLGVALGTVMSRIHRGRVLLRTALAGRMP